MHIQLHLFVQILLVFRIWAVDLQATHYYVPLPPTVPNTNYSYTFSVLCFGSCTSFSVFDQGNIMVTNGSINDTETTIFPLNISSSFKKPKALNFTFDGPSSLYIERQIINALGNFTNQTTKFFPLPATQDVLEYTICPFLYPGHIQLLTEAHKTVNICMRLTKGINLYGYGKLGFTIDEYMNPDSRLVLYSEKGKICFTVSDFKSLFWNHGDICGLHLQGNDTFKVFTSGQSSKVNFPQYMYQEAPGLEYGKTFVFLLLFHQFKVRDIFLRIRCVSYQTAYVVHTPSFELKGVCFPPAVEVLVSLESDYQNGCFGLVRSMEPNKSIAVMQTIMWGNNSMSSTPIYGLELASCRYVWASTTSSSHRRIHLLIVARIKNIFDLSINEEKVFSSVVHNSTRLGLVTYTVDSSYVEARGPTQFVLYVLESTKNSVITFNQAVHADTGVCYYSEDPTFEFINQVKLNATNRTQQCFFIGDSISIFQSKTNCPAKCLEPCVNETNCLNCSMGYVSPLCLPCETNKYGYECLQHCDCFMDSDCHHVTGECQNQLLIPALLFILSVFVISLMIGIFLWWQKNSKEREVDRRWPEKEEYLQMADRGAWILQGKEVDLSPIAQCSRESPKSPASVALTELSEHGTDIA